MGRHLDDGADASRLDRRTLLIAAGAAGLAAVTAPLLGPLSAAAISDTYPYKNGTIDDITEWGFARRNCTDYCAWKINEAGFAAANGKTFTNRGFGGRFGNGGEWHVEAHRLGWTVSTVPKARSVAEYNGHVAWVESVTSDGQVVFTEYNVPANSFAFRGPTTRASSYFSHYIYVPGVTGGGSAQPANLSQWAGWIVQWDGDTKAQRTSWLVQPDLTRVWVPTASVYNWLKSHGAPGPEALPAATLDELHDRTGTSATTDQIGARWTIRRGTDVWSNGGGYLLRFQTDGNLVVIAPGNRPVWATYQSSAVRYVMQTDGNFVGYNSIDRPVWWSGTDGHGLSRLVMQSDGNLVLYRADGRPTWNTRTYGGANRLSNPAGWRI